MTLGSGAGLVDSNPSAHPKFTGGFHPSLQHKFALNKFGAHFVCHQQMNFAPCTIFISLIVLT
ncbi:MAG: hypothetical protein RMK18_12890, partial [Armatimonadota bacterium]|nr:hypothetical protein [Armatimonadota bacterium]